MQPRSGGTEVTAADLREVMPKLTVADGWQNNSIYRDARIHAEHGSSQAMFNAPDPHNDTRTRLPLGYFITRVITTRASRTGETGRDWGCYLDDALEMATDAEHNVRVREWNGKDSRTMDYKTVGR